MWPINEKDEARGLISAHHMTREEVAKLNFDPPLPVRIIPLEWRSRDDALCD